MRPTSSLYRFDGLTFLARARARRSAASSAHFYSVLANVSIFLLTVYLDFDFPERLYNQSRANSSENIYIENRRVATLTHTLTRT